MSIFSSTASLSVEAHELIKSANSIQAFKPGVAQGSYMEMLPAGEQAGPDSTRSGCPLRIQLTENRHLHCQADAATRPVRARHRYGDRTRGMVPNARRSRIA